MYMEWILQKKKNIHFLFLSPCKFFSLFVSSVSTAFHFHFQCCFSKLVFRFYVSSINFSLSKKDWYIYSDFCNNLVMFFQVFTHKYAPLYIVHKRSIFVFQPNFVIIYYFSPKGFFLMFLREKNASNFFLFQVLI